jgi:hypothetical protein
MAEKTPPLPESPELEYLRRHFEELPSRPGYFRGWCSPSQLGPFEKVASGEVHFSLNDPYQRNLPFHVSAAFMVLDEAIRREFLFRNHHFSCLILFVLYGVRRLAQLTGAAPLAVADAEVAKGFAAIRELADKFGMWCHWHDGDGNILVPPQFGLAYSWLADPVYGGRTVRERRFFRQGMSNRLRQLKWPANRAPAPEYLKAALAVWDAREGWQGSPAQGTLGYDPERALSLQEACGRTGAKPDHYYRAFEYVTGHRYSAEHWLVSMGYLWLMHGLEHRSGYKRRNGGRRPRRHEHQKAVFQFFRLLKQGTEIEVAVRLAGLSPDTAETLTAPEYRDQVLAFAGDPDAVEELLSCL